MSSSSPAAALLVVVGLRPFEEVVQPRFLRETAKQEHWGQYYYYNAAAAYWGLPMYILTLLDPRTAEFLTAQRMSETDCQTGRGSNEAKKLIVDSGSQLLVHI